MARRRKKGSMFRKRGQHVATKRMRKLLVTIISLSVGMLVLVPLCYFWLLSWLQGDGFRELLEEKLSNKAKAEITIPKPLQLDGDRVELEKIKWQGTTLIKEAEVTGIEAELTRRELLDRCLHAPQISLKHLLVRLDTRKEDSLSYPEEGDGFFSRFTPNRYVADRIECGNAEVSLTARRSDARKKPHYYTLKGSSFIATPVIGQENNWLVKLRNGTLSTSHSYLAKSSLRHAQLHYTNDTITLSECQLALTKGNMDASGAFHVKKKDWNLTVGVGNADVERLLSERWQEILTGEFSGNLKISGKRSRIHSAEGHISLRKGRFRALSFVLRYLGNADRGDLALHIPGQQAATDYLENTFKLIEINRADCNIRFPHNNKARDIKNAWLFDNIDIRTKSDIIRVVGHVIIAQEGTLHGAIRIGINEQNINEFLSLTTEPIQSLIRSGLQRLLNAEGDAGFRWININLSGTSDEPQQDFSVRVQEIMRSVSPGALIEGAAKTVKDGLNLLPTRKEQKSEEESKERQGSTIIEAAGDTAELILDTGINSIPFIGN